MRRKINTRRRSKLSYCVVISSPRDKKKEKKIGVEYVIKPAGVRKA